MRQKGQKNGILQFCDRNNDPLEWTDEQEPLIEDNAPDPEPAIYPDVLAETRGVVLESNVPAVETPSTLSKDE